MDTKHPVATAAASPDTDGETPIPAQPIYPLSSLPNGKKPHHHPPPTVVAYKECLKNHAATIGSHALDGCGEFMPLPTHCPPELPTSLNCAACGCHRNFHRRELVINDVHAANAQFIEFHQPGCSPPLPTNYAYAPHVLLSLSTGEQNHTVATPGTPAMMKIENPNGRKRFRTKFSQDQKEKMSIFAEKVGWKMQRCDDNLVADFCNEIGIRRGIFKVWMHNNKNTIGKKDKDTISPTTTAAAAITTSIVAAGVSNKDINIHNNSRCVVSRESVDQEDGNVHVRDNSNSSGQETGGGGGRGGRSGVVHLLATNGSSSSC